jgi:XTP/dITP diphosphohydrolase
MNIILATRNPSKAEQIRKMFENSNIRIISLDEANISGEAVEDSRTLQDNALKKARYACEHATSPMWTMADDSGIFIKALNGEPGVESANWAPKELTTDQAAEWLVERLKGIADRSAYFQTVVVIISPEGKEYFFTGTVEGSLLETVRVAPQAKMPYSALFVPDGESKVFAEMTTEYENKISHRGKAFRQAREFLEKVA